MLCRTGQRRGGGVLKLGQAQYRLQTLGHCELGLNGGWVGRYWASEGGGRASQQKGLAKTGCRAGALILREQRKAWTEIQDSWARMGPGQSGGSGLGQGWGPPGQPGPGAQVDSVTPWRVSSPGFGLRPGPDMELIN